MTILGEHTVHELNDLVKALSYEVTQTQKAGVTCTSWAQRDPKAYADWTTKLLEAMGGWSTAVHAAMTAIDRTPQSMWDIVPAEAYFQDCLKAFHPFDDLIRMFMGASQCPISFDQMPQPTAADLDLDAYKAADKAAKWVETVGKQGADKTREYLPWVILGAGVFAGVVVAVRKTIVG